MIEEIEEILVDDKLTISVVCRLRKFATHPIKLLTTKDIYDKVSNKYKNIVLVSSPSFPVGNTNRRKISNKGTWVFKVQQEEQKIEKPKKTRSTTKTTKTKQQTTKQTSIRSRISKIASAKED